MNPPAFRIVDGVAVPVSYWKALPDLLSGTIVTHRLRQSRPLGEETEPFQGGVEALLYLPAGEAVTEAHCAAVERALTRS